MPLLISGLALFIVPHLLRELGWREKIIQKLPSENAYKGLYSLIALLSIVLIVWGKSQAQFTMIWEPRFEWRFVSHILMIPAFVLVFAGNMPPSNLLVTLRNPMMLGTCFWGLAHLWANGDLASIVLFGSFTLWAGFKFISMGRRPQKLRKAPSLLWDIIALVAGLVVYGLVAVYHGELFGVGLSFG